VRRALASSLAVEVIVYDNASTDGCVAALDVLAQDERRLRVLRGEHNLGFAVGCNRALAEATGTYALFLNPDCLVEPDTLATVVAALQADADAGVAGCVIRNPDGSEQRGCRRRLPTPGRLAAAFFGVRRAGYFAIEGALPPEPVAVEAISGAFMLVRREVLDRVGSFDEGYFMHWEDLDLCRRFAAAGVRILFVPTAAVAHVKGHSSRSRPWRVEWHKNLGLLRYLRRHHFRGPAGILLLPIAPLLVLRWLFVMLSASADATHPAPRRAP
jgi:GT2 family glycosyltransferase